MHRPSFPSAATSTAKLKALRLVLARRKGEHAAVTWVEAVGLRDAELEDETQPMALATVQAAAERFVGAAGDEALGELGDALLEPSVIGALGRVVRGVADPAAAILRYGSDVDDGVTVRVEKEDAWSGGFRGRFVLSHDPSLESSGLLERIRLQDLRALVLFFGETRVTATALGSSRFEVRWGSPGWARWAAIGGLGTALAGWLLLQSAVAMVLGLVVVIASSMWLRLTSKGRDAGQGLRLRMLERGLELSERAPKSALGDFEGAVVAGRYRIGRRVGAGASGAVYEAARTEDARPVAIKLLRAATAHDAASSDRLRREAEALGLAWHPNVVEVLDHGRLPDGTTYMVMERLEGETLASRVERHGPMGEANLLPVLEQIAGALVAIHAAGVVHRDLKPDNVFLQSLTGEDLTVKLLDFGIAKVEWEEMRITGSGIPLGTPGFMAPEQEAGEDVDGRADVYAVGALLYAAATGRSPFDVREWAGVAARMRAIGERALSRDPKDRFPDARSLLAELRAATAELRSAAPRAGEALS